MISDDELSARLGAERERIPATLTEGGIRVIARAISPARRSRWRRPLIVFAMLTGIAAGAVAAPAAADGIRAWLAQTGITCSGGTECRPGSELIDASAPDIAEYITAQYPHYLVLPGMSETEVMLTVQSRHPLQEGVMFDSDVLVASYEHVAYCGWIAEWMRADAAGDLGSRDAAGVALTAILDWPGPMQTSPDLIAMREKFAKAARDGDRGGVQTAALHNACPAEGAQ